MYLTSRPDLRVDTSAISAVTPVSPGSFGGNHFVSPSSSFPNSPPSSSPSSASSLFTPSDSLVDASSFYSSSGCHLPFKPDFNSQSRSVFPSASWGCRSPHPDSASRIRGGSPQPVLASPRSCDSLVLDPPVHGPSSNFRFPPEPSSSSSCLETAVPRSPHVNTAASASTAAVGGRVTISHPYARLYARNSQEAKSATKRRKMWNHALEKSVFTPQELSTMRAPQRRAIYIASIEAHVDALHAQLYENSLFPVPLEKLEPYTGLYHKTVKSMVSGLQKDMSNLKLKLLELQRTNHLLQSCIIAHERTAPRPTGALGNQSGAPATRRHSLDSTSGFPCTGVFLGHT